MSEPRYEILEVTGHPFGKWGNAMDTGRSPSTTYSVVDLADCARVVARFTPSPGRSNAYCKRQAEVVRDQMNAEEDAWLAAS